MIEPFVGGAIYEVSRTGERAPWGVVRVWEPGTRLVMSWHPSHDASEAQEVEVRFLPDGEGTRVELEHRDWQGLGAKAAETRGNYDQGWVYVFEHDRFAVTAADGRFRIAGVPAGRHRLTVRQPSGRLARDLFVDVRAGETTTVDVRFTPAN